MTRIVSYVHHYKRPPRKKPKAAALAGPAIVATKKSRRLAGERAQAAAEAGCAMAPPLVTGQRNQAHRARRNVTAP